jgi:hypothetical protein
MLEVCLNIHISRRIWYIDNANLDKSAKYFLRHREYYIIEFMDVCFSFVKSTYDVMTCITRVYRLVYMAGEVTSVGLMGQLSTDGPTDQHTQTTIQHSQICDPFTNGDLWKDKASALPLF